MSVHEEVRAEERSARDRQAHMERMARESRRARVRAAADAAREARRTVRGQLRLAERDEAKATREYERWSARYNDAPDEHAEELGRIVDQKFAAAMRATETVQGLRRELGEL